MQRILIVEEEDIVRTSMREELILDGYIVTAVKNCKDAGRGDYDLAFFEVKPLYTPNADDVVRIDSGEKCLESLALDLKKRGCITVAFSGYDIKAIIAENYKAHGNYSPFDYFQQKPFNLSEFLERVREAA